MSPPANRSRGQTCPYRETVWGALIWMMDGMGRMMWGMALLWLLLIVVLVLVAAALVKYLRSDRTK